MSSHNQPSNEPVAPVTAADVNAEVVSYPHWYHLTPDRMILVLLAVEAVLWFSEGPRWFSFNWHKGWTVLIGVASIVAVVMLMVIWFLVCLLFRWRFQFTIRSLLILTVAVALVCSWLAAEMRRASQQEAAVELIREWASVGYDWEVDHRGRGRGNPQPPVTGWLADLFGNDFFSAAWHVSFHGDILTEREVSQLRSLPELGILSIWNSRMTPEDVQRVRNALPDCSVGVGVSGPIDPSSPELDRPSH